MNKTALITGASRGIGFELSKLFAQDSYNLILIARSKKTLIEIQQDLSKKYNIKVLIMIKDLSVPNIAFEIFNELRNKQIKVDVLVNNAGIGDFDKFQNQKISKISRIMQINIISLTELTRLFIDEMIEEKEGKILNISSMAAFQAGPYMAVYYASKAYVQSFSEAITSELRGTGVTVTTLCPGPTKSGFQQEVGSGNSKLSKFNFLFSSEKVAKSGYKALQKGKSIKIPGLIYRFLLNTSRILPRKIKIKIIRKTQELNRGVY